MSKEFFNLNGDTLVAIDWSNVYGWFEDLGWEIDPQKLYDYLNGYSGIYLKNFYFGKDRHNQKTEGFHEEIEKIGYNLISKNVKWIPVYLEKSHFKKAVKELFNTLDDVRVTNSEISNKLYDINKKVENLPKISIGKKGVAFSLSSEGRLQEIYDLIGELDNILKRLNIDIGDLQRNLIKPVRRRKCDFDVEISCDVYNNLNKMKTFLLFSGDGDYVALVEDIIKKGRQVIVVFGPGHKGKEYDEVEKGLFLCSVNKLRAFIKK
ncbi:NYN domain-containing protein [Candidatus Falkowbacteria bacterium]|nr:NYN domain-containing protein [Candidatus Falkowbacteria bacterium]